MDAIMQNPILMAVVGILLVILFFSLLKKLLRLALIIVAIAIIWLGYMHFFGGGIPEDTMDKLNQTSDVVEDAVDETKTSLLEFVTSNSDYIGYSDELLSGNKQTTFIK